MESKAIRSNVSQSISQVNQLNNKMSFSRKIVQMMEKEVSKKVGDYIVMYYQWNREKWNMSQDSDETKMESPLDTEKMVAFVSEFMTEHPFVLEEEKKMGRPKTNKKETFVEVSGNLADMSNGELLAGDKEAKVKEKKEKVPKEAKVKVPKEKKEKPPKEEKVKVTKEKKEKVVKEKKEKVVKEKKEKPPKEEKVKVVKEKKEKKEKVVKKKEEDAVQQMSVDDDDALGEVGEVVEDDIDFGDSKSSKSSGSAASNDEEQEEAYVTSPKDMHGVLDEVLQGKEGGSNRQAFTHEGVDYYVDLDMTIEDDGQTYNPIKKADNGEIVGRSNGKQKEMFAADDDEDEDDEDDEDEDDEED